MLHAVVELCQYWARGRHAAHYHSDICLDLRPQDEKRKVGDEIRIVFFIIRRDKIDVHARYAGTNRATSIISIHEYPTMITMDLQETEHEDVGHANLLSCRHMKTPDQWDGHEHYDEVSQQVCGREYREHVQCVGALRQEYGDRSPVLLEIRSTLENCCEEERDGPGGSDSNHDPAQGVERPRALEYTLP